MESVRFQLGNTSITYVVRPDDALAFSKALRSRSSTSLADEIDGRETAAGGAPIVLERDDGAESALSALNETAEETWHSITIGALHAGLRAYLGQEGPPTGDPEDAGAARARQVRNQLLFRELNERIDGLHRSAAVVDYVCECTQKACMTTLCLSSDEYQEVRSVPIRFLVAVGHAGADQRVVVETRRYHVVELVGAAAAAAAGVGPLAAQLILEGRGDSS